VDRFPRSVADHNQSVFSVKEKVKPSKVPVLPVSAVQKTEATGKSSRSLGALAQFIANETD
jgi:hypothetical protein